jgi:hypothetical protein
MIKPISLQRIMRLSSTFGWKSNSRRAIKENRSKIFSRANTTCQYTINSPRLSDITRCNCAYDCASRTTLCYTIASRIPGAIKNWNSISRPHGRNFFYSSGPAWFIVTFTFTCSTCSGSFYGYTLRYTHVIDTRL